MMCTTWHHYVLCQIRSVTWNELLLANDWFSSRHSEVRWNMEYTQKKKQRYPLCIAFIETMLCSHLLTMKAIKNLAIYFLVNFFSWCVHGLKTGEKCFSQDHFSHFFKLHIQYAIFIRTVFLRVCSCNAHLQQFFFSL